MPPGEDAVPPGAVHGARGGASAPLREAWPCSLAAGNTWDHNTFLRTTMQQPRAQVLPARKSVKVPGHLESKIARFLGLG